MAKPIKIGISDYTRKEMEQNGGGWFIGISAHEYLEAIADWERAGYTVKFETSLLRRIFGLGKYKVMAYKNEPNGSMEKGL